MTKKKNKGWTFICSLLPGAGEMYMGFMKKGVSIMGLFFVTIAIAVCLNIGPLTILLPIIWCYSFFDVHNMNSMTDEEFYALEDDYLYHLDGVLPMEKIGKKQNRIIAAILIIAGVCILWNQMVHLLRSYMWKILPDSVAGIISDFLYNVPQFVVAIALIAVGVHLIKGKKKQLEQEEKED